MGNGQKKKSTFQVSMSGGVTFLSLLVTRWNILVAGHSLQNHSLLFAKFARYLLQKLLVVKNNSLLVAKFARFKKSLVTRCKNRSLLVAEVARRSLQKCARYSLRNSFVTRHRSCSFQKITGFSLRNSLDAHCKKSFFVKTITRWNYCLFKVNKDRWKF